MLFVPAKTKTSVKLAVAVAVLSMPGIVLPRQRYLLFLGLAKSRLHVVQRQVFS